MRKLVIRLQPKLVGLFVKCDVTNEAQVANLYKVAFDTYNRIDIAFNNAGISPPDDDSILITGLDAWERVLKVNTTSVFLCCKAVLPYMQKAKKGSIINTASFVATMGAATSQIAYTASKGGVLAMSRELGVQFAREGIQSKCVIARSSKYPITAGVIC
jgi:NAD(P)-dependent dehydrogenase (short-subunit alcohol dehydrogenase family)